MGIFENLKACETTPIKKNNKNIIDKYTNISKYFVNHINTYKTIWPYVCSNVINSPTEIKRYARNFFRPTLPGSTLSVALYPWMQVPIFLWMVTVDEAHLVPFTPISNAIIIPWQWYEKSSYDFIKCGDSLEYFTQTMTLSLQYRAPQEIIHPLKKNTT